jgi:hypothetical protein
MSLLLFKDRTPAKKFKDIQTDPEKKRRKSREGRLTLRESVDNACEYLSSVATINGKNQDGLGTVTDFPNCLYKR